MITYDFIYVVACYPRMNESRWEYVGVRILLVEPDPSFNVRRVAIDK